MLGFYGSTVNAPGASDAVTLAVYKDSIRITQPPLKGRSCRYQHDVFRP